MQVVRDAWVCPLVNADPFRVLDHKLRNIAKALKSWSMKNMGSIKLQLILDRKLVGRLEATQDRRALSMEEAALRRRLNLDLLIDSVSFFFQAASPKYVTA